MLDDAYIEAILAWGPGGASPRAEQWLAQRGLRATPMRAGLLVSGDRGAFETAFGVDLSRAEPPVRLTIPAELADSVSSIAIPRPRRILESERSGL